MTYRSFSFIPTLSNNLLSNRFAQMDNLFSRLTGEEPIADTPAYNLLQKDKEHYELTLSVPGYTQDELEISVLNNQLTISGKPREELNDATDEKVYPKWVHRGMRKNEFSVSFSLNHHISVQKTHLDCGQLTLQFTYVIPEEQKPKKIPIGVQNQSNIVLERSAS